MKKLHDMKSLELCTFLNALFSNGIVKEWLHILANGDVYYDNTGIVSALDVDGFIIINAGSVNDAPFSLGMIRKTVEIINSTDKPIIVHSEKPDIFKHLFETKGFRYNTEMKCFQRGV